MLAKDGWWWCDGCWCWHRMVVGGVSAGKGWLVVVWWMSVLA